MARIARSGSRQDYFWVGVAGVGLALLVGFGLIWLGLVLDRRWSGSASLGGSSAEGAAGLPTETRPPLATSPPLPTVTPMPTPLPPTPTSPPMISAGAQGLNVRTGPGTNFTRLAHVDPGTQFPIIGRYADWWQIDFNGAPAWAYSGVVTASNTEGVGEVVPPPSPIPAPTSVPTQVPPTQGPPTVEPTPVPDTRGIICNSWEIHNKGKKKYAPGPFKTNHDVFFDWNITNTWHEDHHYIRLGAWVPEIDKHTKSWTNETLKGGQTQAWQDRMRFKDPGTYSMYLRIWFTDGHRVNLCGPVTVEIVSQ